MAGMNAQRRLLLWQSFRSAVVACSNNQCYCFVMMIHVASEKAIKQQETTQVRPRLSPPAFVQAASQLPVFIEPL